MDLSQSKLSKAEWGSIELPVNENEKRILNLINNASTNLNYKENSNVSLINFMKLNYDPKMELYIFNIYFKPLFDKLTKEYNISFPKIQNASNIKLKKADEIRFNMLDTDKIQLNKHAIYDFILYEKLEKIMKYFKKQNQNWKYYYFTLHHLCKNIILNVNSHLMTMIRFVLNNYGCDISIEHMIYNSDYFIEQNKDILKYKDIGLYTHQKDIFAIFQNMERENNLNGNLILYTAPTGTGKTLTPIGLSNYKKIIFVCAARHIGLALAKASISVNKKIAFAFGCSDAHDIRLHYYAATDFTVNFKSGGIYKVDNSVGDKVEIMICDVKSYLPAMHYMLAFNDSTDLITYWDEPTISMDYENHPLHEILHKNWNENLIPNLVLSSATLPKEQDIFGPISEFRNKFPNSIVSSIHSYDCVKSISLIDPDGFVIVPHYLSDNYIEVKLIAIHLKENLNILRYLDLKECIKFIKLVEANKFIKRSCYIANNFDDIDDVNMDNIKLHYLKCLEGVIDGTWTSIYLNLKINRERKILYNPFIDINGQVIEKSNSIGTGCKSTSLPKENKDINLIGKSSLNTTNDNMRDKSSVYITTGDACTLTDGPTIYLTNNIQQISGFCISQACIPNIILKDIYEKIGFNDDIQKKIENLESLIDTEVEKQNKKDDNDDKKKTSEESIFKNKNIRELQNSIEQIRSLIKEAALDNVYIPNTAKHKQKWFPSGNNNNSFSSNVDETIVREIMLLPIQNPWKVLLIMGIGVFTTHDNISYREIIKKLTDEQLLYLIIADTDYIYGTNYQFCHAILSKDITMSQEKLIQAIGRVGRNNIQQDYSVRFRNKEHSLLLFQKILPENKIEVINMNKIFS
jgi:hypothetical protein